ncbi:MAG: hypothetical protein ABEJ40_10975 [Haloarculaceae archaeon]
MSIASPLERSPSVRSRIGAQQFASLVVGPARAAGFWAAVTIPFVLLGFAATGSAAQHAPLFGALVVANFVALRLGHDYNRE